MPGDNLSPMIAVTAEEMRSLEEATARRQNVPSFTLMDRAGGGVFRTAFKLLAATAGTSAVIIAGKGNNGGDGFIAGELLAQSGVKVTIFTTVPHSEITGDAAKALAPLLGSKIEPVPLTGADNLGMLKHSLDRADLVIDAILGTGVKGAPRGPANEAIISINQHTNCPVVSVDVPSGVDSDTGQVEGSAVSADITATIGLPKIGLYFHPAAELVGQIDVIDISIPDDAASETTATRVPDHASIRGLLPDRAQDSHKKQVGVVSVIAGSRGMTGAAVLSTNSVLKSGAGLVYLWAARSLVPAFEARLTEVIIRSAEEAGAGAISDSNIQSLVTETRDQDCALVGPGIGSDARTVSLVRRLMIDGEIERMVIDADGLNALVGSTELLTQRRASTILTPHPGELARLMDSTTDAIQSDRPGWAKKAANGLNCTVVLKGARSIVASPGGQMTICTTGNPGLATAGTGDVLAGMITGFWAQQMTPHSAAVLGTYLHGLAGDIAQRELTTYSMTASDVMGYLPDAIKAVSDQV